MLIGVKLLWTVVMPWLCSYHNGVKLGIRQVLFKRPVWIFSFPCCNFNAFQNTFEKEVFEFYCQVDHFSRKNMCGFYFSVLFFKWTIGKHTHKNKKDDKKDNNTISSLVPLMLAVLNLKLLIVSACNLRSLSTSSLLMLAKSRGGIFIYVKN